MAQAKSRATLRLIEGGALKAAGGSSPPRGYFGPPALLARQVQSSFNYCIYFCARWIGRIQRHRCEALVRS